MIPANPRLYISGETVSAAVRPGMPIIITGPAEGHGAPVVSDPFDQPSGPGRISRRDRRLDPPPGRGGNADGIPGGNADDTEAADIEAKSL